MNILINKLISAFHVGNLPIEEPSDNDNKTNDSFFQQFIRWERKSKPQVCI